MLLLTLVGCNSSNTRTWQYPTFETSPVVDEYFGIDIVDDHRMMERSDTSSVVAWYSQQKDFYSTIMGKIDGIDSLRSEIRNLVSSSGVRAPVPRIGGERLFIKRTFDNRNVQSLLYFDSVAQKEVELFNTGLYNNSDLTYSIDYYEPSWNGQYVVLGISVNGGEVSNLYTIDVERNKILKDTIKGCYNANPNWLPDGSGFVYNHLKEIQTERDQETKYERSRVRVHLIGSNPDRDLELFSSRINESLNLKDIDFPYMFTFPHSDKILAYVYRGSSIYGLLYFSTLKDVLSNPKRATWQKIADQSNKVTSFALFNNDLFLLNFAENQNGVVKTLSLETPGTSVNALEREGLVLKEIAQNENAIFIKYLREGVYGLLQLNPLNLSVKEIDQRFSGSITLMPEGKVYSKGLDLYVGMEGWTKEWAIYKYDGDKFALTKIRPQGQFGNPDFLVSKEVLVPSYDGTLVPLSIIHHKDVTLDGTNPTIIFGYGAYGISVEPGFDVTQLAWFKRGGIYAMTHVRGGGEKGDEWYKGGFKATKANSWKDFIACARYLIDKRYTSPEKLAAFGASAGGITVGRAITESPKLFKAAVIQVGALNSIRAETSMNTLLVSEFGTVSDSVEFQYLLDMDVYHHVKKEVRYPSVLFTGAMNDARVASWEPAKVVARMQQYGTGDNIALLRVSEQGHFSEMDFINQTAEIYAFLLWQLDHPGFKYVTDHVDGR